MPEITLEKLERRRTNLLWFIDSHFAGNQSKFASAAGISTNSYVSRMLSEPHANGHKNIKEDMVAKIEAAFAPIIAPGWLDAPDIAEHVARAQHIIDEVPGVYRPRDTDSGRQTLLNEVFRLISYLPTRHLPDLIGYLDQKLQQNRVDKDEGSLLNKIESTHEKPNLSVFGKGPTTS